jgi:hypothetical protein
MKHILLRRSIEEIGHATIVKKNIANKTFFCFKESIAGLRGWMDTYHALKVGDPGEIFP